MFVEAVTKPPVILIVDDLATNIRILGEAVRDLGKIFFATSGQAALAVARQCRPDVVLLDIEMCDMDGYQVCQAFKKDPQLCDAAVIFVTLHGQPEFELRALGYGAVDFIQKPINVSVARARIKTHIALRIETLKLASARHDLEALVLHLPAYIAFWSDGLLNLYCNDLTGRWFGVAAADIQNMPMAQVIGERNYLTVQRFLPEVRMGNSPHFELELQPAERGIRFAQVTLVARTSENETSGFVMLMTDITANKSAETERLKYLARHDDLTHLPNRLMLQECTELALQEARCKHQRVGMLVLDIDHFKAINDADGQAAGDQLLRILAKRMEGCCRSTDVISRQDGDAFSLLLPDIASVEMLKDFSEQLLGFIGEPIWLDDHRYDLRASIGISVFPDDSEDADALYRHAESAMYEAKKQGRHRWHFFNAQIESDLRALLQRERDLRAALASEAFEVHYQAKVDAGPGRICGVEALVRWPGAPDGPVSPSEFIPLAESTGLIWALGKWVLLRACNDARYWQDNGLPVCVSVNISVVQFAEEGFLDLISDALTASGLRPELLELEITEGVLLKETQRALEKLAGLRQLGVRIAIDDFGTGYSSLAYLKHFPINVLKIDQSFIRDMLDHRADAAIIKAIILLGHSLSLELVAEGVETPGQSDALLALGCPVMQGFLFSQPVPFRQMSQFLSMEAVQTQ
jgi:diguanylate cyclase (GGDEF)-like protein